MTLKQQLPMNDGNVMQIALIIIVLLADKYEKL